MGRVAKTIVVVFLFTASSVSMASQYRVHDLGSLVGTSFNMATAINASGLVTIHTSDRQSAYLWSGSEGLQNITVPGRLNDLSDTNDFGDVIGSGGSFPEALVLRRASGEIIDLDRPSGLEYYEASITAINNSVQVAGTIGSRAVFWASPDTPIDISGSNDLTNGAIDLNDHGQLLWSATWQTAEGTFIQPYIWTQVDGSTPLALSQGSQYAIAMAINDEGVAVGRSDGPVRWLANGTIESLPTLGSAYGNCAHGLNDKGRLLAS